MRIGVRAPFSVESVTMAARLGFDCVELCLGEGVNAEAAKLKKDDIGAIQECLGECGIRVASLWFFENFLGPNKKDREKHEREMLATIDIAAELDCFKVTTSVGANPGATLEQNLEEYKRVFGKFAHHAKTKEVFIAIENCPHIHIDEGGRHAIGNIACSPDMFRAMFKALPNDRIGIEYDPSHMVWLGIDYIRFIYDFEGKILECHAKDTEVLDEKLKTQGIYGRNWWRYRIPGLGEADWKAVFRALYDTSFTGNVIIEHEDPVFEGKRFEEGLSLGLKYLRQFTI